jgi:acetyl-CoA acetyltransferase
VAIPNALGKVGMNLNDRDLIEVNEAFAAQFLANESVLSWDAPGSMSTVGRSPWATPLVRVVFGLSLSSTTP